MNRLDILPSWLFKVTAKVLMPVLVCFINCVLKKGMPVSYKHAVITPILQGNSSDSEDFKSFRPVSNFPTLVKIIERIVAKQMIDHLERENLTDPHQSVYKHGHSCETVILSVLNDVYGACDRYEISILAMLDMNVAFDTVDHELLLEKLKCFGFDGEILEWLRTYLTGRSHSTTVEGSTSEPLSLPMGVPQGSVLGPLLFTIYISDLQEPMQRCGIKYHVYADDIQLLTHVKPQNSQKE
jgi:hypothetical protein